MDNKKDMILITSKHEDVLNGFDDKLENKEQRIDNQASYLRSLMIGKDDRLGKIGVGVQYVVYELPNNRVLKVAQTSADASEEYYGQGGKDDNEFNEALVLRDAGVDYVNKLISIYPETSSIFGNPIFNGEYGIAGAYEQDKLNILGKDGFNTMSDNEQIEYIYKYMNLIKTMWSYGCSDRTMNFQVNTGMDEDGDIVMADFGEMYTEKDDALQIIKNVRWESAWGFSVLNQDVKKFAISLFESELTESAINEIWAKNLNNDFNAII